MTKDTPQAGAGRPRILLLDGHSLAYRAFYALPVENFSTTTGQHTNAVYGFTSMLINMLRDEQPTHICVAFDVSRKTFRSEQYAEYKAGRSKSPDEFKGQVSLVKEVLEALRIPTTEIDGWEADDIIATLATQASEQGFEVLISSGDRDAFQQLKQLKGKGSSGKRTAILRELFARATADEQDFLARLMVGELRQGALEGILMDAVARASGIQAGRIRRAAMLAGDLASVARAALVDGDAALAQFILQPFQPVQPMLADSASDVGDALATLGQASFESIDAHADVPFASDGATTSSAIARRMRPSDRCSRDFAVPSGIPRTLAASGSGIPRK